VISTTLKYTHLKNGSVSDGLNHLFGDDENASLWHPASEMPKASISAVVDIKGRVILRRGGKWDNKLKNEWAYSKDLCKFCVKKMTNYDDFLSNKK
jgi:hypothetical protein